MKNKTTKTIGDEGEQQAVEYLKQQGFVIVHRNWRTRWCEIDIVAKKQRRVYFVEVKTRKTENYGMAIEYVTPKKLEQMVFAAEFWVHENKWPGEWQLAAIGVTGQRIMFVTDF